MERDVVVGGVAEGGSWVEAVVVASTRLGDMDVALAGELAEDPVGCAFGDADGVGDCAQSGVRVSGDVEENLEVVREEPPLLLPVT